MCFIWRHFGVITKESKVELFNSQERTANCLHTHIGQVDVEVTGEETAYFGLTVGEFIQGVVAAAHVAVAPTEQDAVLPAKLLTQRARRNTENLASVSPGVVRPALTRRSVCHPTISHISSPQIGTVTCTDLETNRLITSGATPNSELQFLGRAVTLRLVNPRKTNESP